MFKKIAIAALAAVAVAGTAHADELTDTWREVVSGYGLYAASYQLCEHAPPVRAVMQIMDIMTKYPGVEMDNIAKILTERAIVELQRFGQNAGCSEPEVHLFKDNLDRQIADLIAALDQ